jgi:membrane protein DedA with SNARE-associated domain
MGQWLSAVSPAIVYLAVFLVVGGQFVCLPLPGGVALTTAGLLAVRGSVEPWLVCVAAVTGVLAGSAVGYRLGRRGGRAALDRLTRRFPRVFPPKRLATAERLFARWGSWILVASCFSAVPRMVGAPLAGTLSIPVRRFGLAMAASAVLWSVGTTTAIYYLGRAAESWIDGLSWVGLAMLALASVPSWFRSASRPAEPERYLG